MNNKPPIPKQYQTIMPYLILPKANNFISFMITVFDAKESYRVMRDETCIMHAEIMIHDSTIMLADATETYPARPAGLFVFVHDADETFAKALAEGASIVSPISDQPYGRSGGVTDPFGNTWWITAPIR